MEDWIYGREKGNCGSLLQLSSAILAVEDFQVIPCQSSHLTTFTSAFVVEPNVIDWDFVFNNLDFYKNMTIYITEIIIVVLYIAVAIWARREDKKDVAKVNRLNIIIDNE